MLDKSPPPAPTNIQVVDAQKWTIFNGDGCGSQLGCGWGTEQLGTSSPTNVGIDNGHLVITVRHNSNTDDTWSSSSERATSSGRVSTAGSANFVYGRIDVRAKVPLKGWGGLAGVWLVPSQDIPRGDSPSCSRVDVMEVNSTRVCCLYHFQDITCITSTNNARTGSLARGKKYYLESLPFLMKPQTRHVSEHTPCLRYGCGTFFWRV